MAHPRFATVLVTLNDTQNTAEFVFTATNGYAFSAVRMLLPLGLEHSLLLLQLFLLPVAGTYFDRGFYDFSSEYLSVISILYTPL